jgi:hypothetical protein
MNTPTITDWISAISTATLGVLGAVFGVWQWIMAKFRPKPSARIDARREAIELWIINKGRATGVIDQIEILLPNEIVEDRARFESFPGNNYRPLSLPAMSSMRIIIQAPPGTTFDAGTQVSIGMGRTKPKAITPTEITSGLAIYGLKSVLPPGVSRILQREAQELAQLPSAEQAGEHLGDESPASPEQPPSRRRRR